MGKALAAVRDWAGRGTGVSPILIGVPAHEGRGVLLRFAALDPPVRRLAFDIVVRGRALSEVASELHLEPGAAAREFDTALHKIGAIGSEPAPLYAPWQALLDQILFEDGDY